MCDDDISYGYIHHGTLYLSLLVTDGVLVLLLVLVNRGKEILYIGEFIYCLIG